MARNSYYVYLLTNALKTVLYTGVTNNLEQRIMQHYESRGQTTSFTGRYNAYYLIYYEVHHYINSAIDREKEIKGWSRGKKLELAASLNPSLDFLNEELFGSWPPEG